MSQLSEEQINKHARKIANCYNEPRIVCYMFTRQKMVEFARAIEREAYKRGQEDMRERAVKKCEEIETKYHRKWKKDYLPQDQGISNGASECAYDIRYLEIEEPK